MFKRLISLALPVFALSFLSTSARADDLFTLTYVPTGTVDTFTLPSTPTVSLSDGYSFTLDNMPVDANGTIVTENLTFYNGPNGGALAMQLGPALYGPQLYGGVEADPTFLPGSYVLTDYIDPDYSLNITSLSVTSTPEPSSLLLLGTGILGVGTSVFRRRRS